MGRLRVRNPKNSLWIDICQSEWYTRNSSNDAWTRLIPARGLRARHGTDNYWINIDCLSEEDCGDDQYGGTEDGKGTNGSGPGAGDNVGGDTGYPGSGPDGGSTIDPWPSRPGSGDGGGVTVDPWPGTGGGDMSSGGDRYSDPDAGSSDSGEGDSSCYQGTYDGTSYPPGYDLPDGCGNEDDSGLQTNEDGDMCIYRPGLGVCEPYDQGGNSTSDEDGTSDDPASCPVTIYGRDRTITETYVNLGTKSGEVRIEFNIYKGKASIDAYYAGRRVVTTNGRRDGKGYLSFQYDAASGPDDKLMVRVRQTDGAKWFVTTRCPDSAEDDDEGTITNPAPCHGTYEPKEGSGAQEMIHDFGSKAGQAIIEYQMWSVGDRMDVFYGGNLVATTGGIVSGEGSLSWNHQPVDGNTLVTIRVTSNTDDTGWVYQITCPGEQGSSFDPKDCGDIDTTTKSGGAGVTDTYYELGLEPGTVKVRYQMWNIADSLDVYQGNNLVASTNGPVVGEDRVSFDYNPNNGTTIRVRVTGQGKTTWAFLVECAETLLACGESWSGSDDRTVDSEIEATNGQFALVEYTSIAEGIGVGSGDPNRIQVSAGGTVLEDTGNERMRWEDHGYGTLAIPVNGSMNSLSVRSPNATSYWRQTVQCPVSLPTDGARFSDLNKGLPQAYPLDDHGDKLSSGAQAISITSNGLIAGNTAFMAVNMFHTTTGKLRIEGTADDWASVFIGAPGGQLNNVANFALSGTTSKDINVSPGTHFIYVLVENAPDDTPGWVVAHVKERDTGKVVSMTSNDWRIGYFGINYSYPGNSVIIPEVEALMFDNDSDAQTYMSQNAAPSMQDIFNTWPRTDGGTYYAPGTAQGEAADWYYDSGSDQFVMPTNTAQPNTILSPEEFDNYKLEATLTSGNSDDDAIGLVLAATLVNGTPHILAVVRTQGGFPHPSSGYGIVYYDGASFTTIANLGNNDDSGKWDGRSTRVSVSRSGDNFTIDATQFGGGNFPTHNFSLNSKAVLAKFKGPARYGFYTLSQPGSTYKDVVMPNAEGLVFSASSGKTWAAQSGNWVDKGADPSPGHYLQWPRVAVNPQTNNKYHVFRKIVNKI